MKRLLLITLAISIVLGGCSFRRKPLTRMVFKGTAAAELIKCEILEFGSLENSTIFFYARFDIENHGPAPIIFDPGFCFLVLSDKRHIKSYDPLESSEIPPPPMDVSRLVTRPYSPKKGAAVEEKLGEAMEEANMKVPPRVTIAPRSFLRADVIWPFSNDYPKNLEGIKLFAFREGRPIQFYHQHMKKMPMPVRHR